MSQDVLQITRDREAILIALARFHYLTTAQVSRLFHANADDEDRWSQRHLKRLVDAQYVLRLRALPPQPTGRPAHVFTLAQRGRGHMKALGVPVETYFRPSEEKKAALNMPFMPHTLAAIDVLVSAACLCRDHDVSTPRMLTERQLRHRPLRVAIPPGPRNSAGGTRTRPVIPDGWFQLQVGRGAVLSIALELDRGTQAQGAWREKVAGLALWATGPYREAFEATNLTVMVACSQAEDAASRRDSLAEWTLAELTDRHMSNLAHIFLFTAVDPAVVAPAEFFFGRCWRSPVDTTPLCLLDSPPESEVVSLEG